MSPRLFYAAGWVMYALALYAALTMHGVERDAFAGRGVASATFFVACAIYARIAERAS